MDLLKELGIQENEVKEITSLTENLMKYEAGEQVLIKFVKVLSDSQMLVYVLTDAKTRTMELKKVWMKSKIKYFIDEGKIKENGYYLIICNGLKKMKGRKNTFYDFTIKELNLNDKDFNFIN